MAQNGGCVTGNRSIGRRHPIRRQGSEQERRAPVGGPVPSATFPRSRAYTSGVTARGASSTLARPAQPADELLPADQLHPRNQTMVLTARSLEWTVVGTELESLTLEYTWIKEFDPRFNVVFRDDKTYPYLAISSGERIPRVWVTRSRKRRDTRYACTPRQPRRVARCACSKSVFHKAQLTGRPCLLASIGKCSAPCVNRIGADEHRRMCEQLVGVMTGRIGKSYIVENRNELPASRRTRFFVERVEDVSDAELIADLITQVYSETTGESASTVSDRGRRGLRGMPRPALQPRDSRSELQRQIGRRRAEHAHRCYRVRAERSSEDVPTCWLQSRLFPVR